MFSKILAATDGTPHSTRAIETASAIASRFGGKLTICAVNVGIGGPRAPLIYTWDDEEAFRLLTAAAETAHGQGAKDPETVSLRSRDAAAAIVQYGEENGFDLIVVGTGDKRGMSRLMLGSVAADVSGRAHCSVIVAR